MHYRHPSESAQDECLLEQSSILSFNVYKNHGCSQQPPPLWLSCSVCQGQDHNMEITSVPFPNIRPRGLQPPSAPGIPCFVLFPSDAILRSFFHLILSLWRPQGSPPGPPKMTTDPTAGVLCPFPIRIQASPGCPVKSTSDSEGINSPTSQEHRVSSACSVVPEQLYPDQGFKYK